MTERVLYRDDRSEAAIRTTPEGATVIVERITAPLDEAQRQQVSELCRAVARVAHPALGRSRGRTDPPLAWARAVPEPESLEDVAFDAGGALPARAALTIARALVDGLCALDRAIPRRPRLALPPLYVGLQPDGGVVLRDPGLLMALLIAGPGPRGPEREHAAPELLRGEVGSDRSEVFAVATLVHQLVAGTSGFDAARAVPAVSGALEAPLRALLEPCLRAAPSERPSLVELRGALERVPAVELAGLLGPPKAERSEDAPHAALLAPAALAPSPAAPLRRPTVALDPALGADVASTLPTDPRAARPDPRPDASDDTAESPRDPLLGAQLYAYRLEALIGEGSHARVYRARHVHLGVEAAVKVLKPELGGVGLARDRLAREARVLLSVSHPNVVRLLDSGVTADGLGFIVTELYAGPTLAEVLARGLPEHAEVRAWVVQIARGLAAAHAAGAVHRDLKASNVVLAETGAKLLDFGTARVVHTGEALTALGMMVGTPESMAPEQIRGAPDVGPAADLYALGVLIHRMLTGAAPFQGSVSEVLEQHRRARPPPLSTRSGLEPLVARLLEKEPERRPASADEVVAWVESLEAEEGVRTRVPEPRAATPARAAAPAPPRGDPAERRARLEAYGAVVVAGLAVVIAALARW